MNYKINNQISKFKNNFFFFRSFSFHAFLPLSLKKLLTVLFFLFFLFFLLIIFFFLFFANNVITFNCLIIFIILIYLPLKINFPFMSHSYLDPFLFTFVFFLPLIGSTLISLPSLAVLVLFMHLIFCFCQHVQNNNFQQSLYFFFLNLFTY